MECGNDRVFPLLWNVFLAPGAGGRSVLVELQDGLVLLMLKSEFQHFHVKASGPTAFAFSIAFIAEAISSSAGSIPRALATGCCESSLGCRDLACRISRSAASGRIASISRRYALFLAAAPLPRHGHSAIRPSSSPPPAPI